MEDDSRMVEWGETPQLGEVICREPLQGMGTAISDQLSAETLELTLGVAHTLKADG